MGGAALDARHDMLRPMARAVAICALAVALGTAVPTTARADDGKHLLGIGPCESIATETATGDLPEEGAPAPQSLEQDESPAEGAETAADVIVDQGGSDGIDAPATIDDAPFGQRAIPAESTPGVSDRAEGGAGLKAQDASGDEGLALPHGAAHVKEGTYVIECGVADDKVLGVGGKSPAERSKVSSWTFGKSGNQTWDVKLDEASGWYHILLAGSNGKLALGKPSKESDYEVELLDPVAVGDRALWAFVKNGSWFNLINRSLPDRMLDISRASTANGAQVKLYKTDTSAKNRRFYLLEANPSVGAGDVVNEGAYVLTAHILAQTTGASLVVEVSGGSTKSGADVKVGTAGNKSYQKIYLEPDGEGYYVAWVVGTGKALAQEGSSVVPGNNIVQKTYSKAAATQRWALRAHGDGTYSLVNKATGLAMGVRGNKSGADVRGTRNDGYSSAYQTTRFKLTRAALLSAGIVEIHPRTSSVVSLDVRGASTGTAGLLLWTDTNGLNQRFELVSAGGVDMWRVRTASSGGWLTEMGTDVSEVRQTGKGSDAKIDANTWRVTFTGGWFTLVNAATGKALDMWRGETAKGTVVNGYPLNGRNSQHFTFEYTTLIRSGYYFLQNGGSRYLDVKRTSVKSGANIQVYEETDKVGQLFLLETSGSNWLISNSLSGLYLTAEEGTKGANVAQQKLTKGKKIQLWRIGIADGGSIRFISAANAELLLHAYNDGAKNSANVYLTTSTNSAGQSWKPIALTHPSLTSRQQAVLEAAKRTPSAGPGYCAGWITNVFRRAGIGYWAGDARDQYRWFCTSDKLTDLQPGMIVAVSSHGRTRAGSIWGHVAVYIGNGLIMDNVGPIRTMSLYQWIAWYGDRMTPKWGWFGKSLR